MMSQCCLRSCREASKQQLIVVWMSSLLLCTGGVQEGEKSSMLLGMGLHASLLMISFAPLCLLVTKSWLMLS